MPEIVDRENLYLAYIKARRSKEGRPEVFRYSRHLDKNIDKLVSILEGETSLECDYRQFEISDPKKRIICAAPFEHRVLQHALINVCGPLIDKRLIHDTYACRKSKGQYKAIERARRWHGKYKWCVKLDIRKYFDSIDHLKLKGLLYRTFKEERLLCLLYSIIDGYDSGLSGRGIPIGNLTSQYFANFYLGGLDKYIKETLKVKAYVRYMDDMLIYGDDPDTVNKWIIAIRKYVTDTLDLEFKVVDRRSTEKGVSFLGYRIYSDHIKLNVRSKKRYRKKMAVYNHYYRTGIWGQEELKSHLGPLIAFASKAKSYRLSAGINSKLIWP